MADVNARSIEDLTGKHTTIPADSKRLAERAEKALAAQYYATNRLMSCRDELAKAVVDHRAACEAAVTATLELLTVAGKSCIAEGEAPQPLALQLPRGITLHRTAESD